MEIFNLSLWEKSIRNEYEKSLLWQNPGKEKRQAKRSNPDLHFLSRLASEAKDSDFPGGMDMGRSGHLW